MSVRRLCCCCCCCCDPLLSSSWNRLSIINLNTDDFWCFSFEFEQLHTHMYAYKCVVFFSHVRFRMKNCRMCQMEMFERTYHSQTKKTPNRIPWVLLLLYCVFFFRAFSSVCMSIFIVDDIPNELRHKFSWNDQTKKCRSIDSIYLFKFFCSCQPMACDGIWKIFSPERRLKWMIYE